MQYRIRFKEKIGKRKKETLNHTGEQKYADTFQESVTSSLNGQITKMWSHMKDDSFLYIINST